MQKRFFLLVHYWDEAVTESCGKFPLEAMSQFSKLAFNLLIKNKNWLKLLGTELGDIVNETGKTKQDLFTFVPNVVLSLEIWSFLGFFGLFMMLVLFEDVFIFYFFLNIKYLFCYFKKVIILQFVKLSCINSDISHNIKSPGSLCSSLTAVTASQAQII